MNEETCDGDMLFAEESRRLLEEEDGVGVIEIVLILVILIGLVAVFKNQINTLLRGIFENINTMSDEVMAGNGML
jgi:Flp pilus assembly pilin Flp